MPAPDEAAPGGERVRAAELSRREYRPGVTFDDAELAAIQRPTLCVYGTADPVGTIDIWRRSLGLLPQGELQLVEGAGHMPWFDEPGRVAADVSRFLAG